MFYNIFFSDLIVKFKFQSLHSFEKRIDNSRRYIRVTTTPLSRTVVDRESLDVPEQNKRTKAHTNLTKKAQKMRKIVER